MNRYIKLIISVCFFISLFLIACSKKAKQTFSKEEIIAQVGDLVITADDFKKSYEFSFAPLRMGGKPRRVYLNHLINETLIANEGYRLGYNKNPYVTKRLLHRRYDNLLESFYTKHVHGKVNIPEEKIREAASKSTVTWRMIIWPTQSLEEAEEAYKIARQTSLEDYIENKINQKETQLTKKEFFETDWIDFLDLRPEILEKIKDLEVGTSSEPIPFNDGFALFQILDIHRKGVTEDELKYGSRRKKIERRLHNIEADRIVHSLMDSIITPLDVRLKGQVVNEITPLLYNWVQDGLPKKGSIVTLVENPPDTAKAYVKELRSMLDHTLLTTKTGKHSVKDYLEHMNYYRTALKNSESYGDFKEILITEIGRMVKNDVFIDIAEEQGFADSLNVVNDLRVWEQKWTYDIFRHELVADLDVTEEEMHDYFKHRWKELDIADVDTTRFYKYENAVFNAVLHEKHMARLNEKLEKLREQYPVWINEPLLNQLELSETAKSLQTSFFVTKNFSGKPVVPIADMKWLHF